MPEDPGATANSLRYAVATVRRKVRLQSSSLLIRALSEAITLERFQTECCIDSATPYSTLATFDANGEFSRLIRGFTQSIPDESDTAASTAQLSAPIPLACCRPRAGMQCGLEEFSARPRDTRREPPQISRTTKILRKRALCSPLSALAANTGWIRCLVDTAVQTTYNRRHRRFKRFTDAEQRRVSEAAPTATI